jgi:hypothetical protein
MSERTKIAFADMDGTMETLWATGVGRGWYRLENTPFFYYGVSLGDVVQASWPDEEHEDRDEGDDGAHGFPHFETLVEKSGNRTLRLALVRETGEEVTPVCAVNSDEARPILNRIVALGCSYETFPPYLVAINAPPRVDLDRVMAMLEASGLKWENGDPRWDAVPGRTCYLFQLAERGEDLFGGSPPGVDGRQWPQCGECRSPMTFAMLLARHHQRLRLRRWAAVALFHCTRHPGQPHRRDHSAVVLLDSRQLAGKTGLVGGGPLEQRRLRYLRSEEPNPWAAGSYRLGHSPVHKIGGYPRWRGDECTPLCRHCHQPMALVAQLDGELDPGLNLDGVGYLFLCPDEHEGRFVLVD